MRSRLALTLVTMVAIVAITIPAIASRAWAQGDVATPGAETTNEIVVDGARYAFDRTVTVDLSQLEQRADDSGNAIWVDPGDPVGAVYTEREGAAARYLPEHLGAPDIACPSDATASAGTIQGSFGGTEVTYIPAGPEPDLSPDQLTQITQASDGRIVYALSSEQPFPELFVTDPAGGLVHYIAIEPNGVPATFPERLDFAGQTFQLTAGESAGGDQQKIGCALGFPALADAGEAPGSLSSITIQAGDTGVVYRAIGPVAPSTSVVTPGTPAPTLAPTVAPTVPPTVAPTVPPTVAPTIPPTLAPTSTPEPTATVSPTPTPEPTATATAAPTDAATTAPTAAPTTAPTSQPTAPAAVTTPTPRPTPTPQVLQPPAVVPTLPPNAPPPAASTAPAIGCTGTAGPIGADGLPERLPPALQFQGNGYRFAERVSIEAIGDLDRVGCVGAFEAFVDADNDVLYLTLGTVSDSAFRYERASSFEVRVEVTADPRVLVLQGEGDQPDVRYRAADPLVRSVYSSVTLILFVPDPEDQQPARILGFAQDADLIGEYRLADDAEPASEEVQARAGEHGILPTLTIGTNPQEYVLVALWEPFGTTTNGWLTLYAPAGETAPDQLVGADPRRLDLAVFDRQGS